MAEITLVNSEKLQNNLVIPQMKLFILVEFIF